MNCIFAFVLKKLNRKRKKERRKERERERWGKKRESRQKTKINKLNFCICLKKKTEQGRKEGIKRCLRKKPDPGVGRREEDDGRRAVDVPIITRGGALPSWSNRLNRGVGGGEASPISSTNLHPHHLPRTCSSHILEEEAVFPWVREQDQDSRDLMPPGSDATTLLLKQILGSRCPPSFSSEVSVPSVPSVAAIVTVSSEQVR